jgi:hypothetical protein
MCDCYLHKCEGCGKDISIHISDFCTERENVHPYCPVCTRTLSKKKIRAAVKVFEDKITDHYQVKRSRIGSRVVILCDDEAAYDVSLN